MSQDTPEPQEERSGSYVADGSTDPRVLKTARQVRKIGYIIAVPLILWIVAPVVYGVVHGAATDQARDPYLGAPVGAENPGTAGDCVSQATAIIESEQVTFVREARSRWLDECGAEHPTLAKMVDRSPGE